MKGEVIGNKRCHLIHMNHIKLLVLLFLSATYNVVAQTRVYEQPVYYNQYFNDPQINSNNFKPNESAIFLLGHKRNNNNFGGVNTSIFSGTYNLKKKDSDSKVIIGLQFISDREGFLIRRNSL